MYVAHFRFHMRSTPHRFPDFTEKFKGYHVRTTPRHPDLFVYNIFSENYRQKPGLLYVTKPRRL